MKKNNMDKYKIHELVLKAKLLNILQNKLDEDKALKETQNRNNFFQNKYKNKYINKPINNNKPNSYNKFNNNYNNANKNINNNKFNNNYNNANKNINTSNKFENNQKVESTTFIVRKKKRKKLIQRPNDKKLIIKEIKHNSIEFKKIRIRPRRKYELTVEEKCFYDIWSKYRFPKSEPIVITSCKIHPTTLMPIEYKKLINPIFLYGSTKRKKKI